MKRYMLLVLMIFAIVCLRAVDFHSSVIGGDWGSPTTWNLPPHIPGPDDNVWIHGPVTVNGDYSCNDLFIDTNGSLKNSGRTSRTLTINGDLKNHGIMQNGSSNYLKVKLKSGLYNYNSIINNEISFEGTSQHNLWQDMDAEPIACQNFKAGEECGPIQLLSDIRFSSCSINLENATMKLHQEGAGKTLFMDGGSLQKANLEGGHGATLFSELGTNLERLNIDEIIFDGVIQVYSNVKVDRLKNQGTIKNQGGYTQTLIVNEMLENYGDIMNYASNRVLHVDCFGDLINYGSLNNRTINIGGDLYNYNRINNTTIVFTGDNQHNLWQDMDAEPIACQNFKADQECGPIQLLSDISFSSCSINLEYATLKLYQEGAGKTLFMDGGSLQKANLEGGHGATLFSELGTNLERLNIDEIIFDGVIQVYSNVKVDRLKNQGTIKNQGGYTQTLIVNERLENHGDITNYGSNRILHVDCFGDLVNYGSLLNRSFNFKGEQNQYILIVPESIVNVSQFNLVSNVGPALWSLDEGEPSQNYKEQITINPAEHGVWKHWNQEGQYGRLITIGSGIEIAQPQNLRILRSAGMIRLEWDEVSNANSYRIYQALAPEGPWELKTIAYDYNPGDGIVFWEFYPTERHLFFRVTAQN